MAGFTVGLRRTKYRSVPARDYIEVQAKADEVFH